MRLLHFILGLAVSGSIFGQITIDKPVVLTNGQHVTGLEVPTQGDHALNATSLQNAGFMYCESVGVNALSTTLLPMPDSLVQGLTIHLQITSTNSGGASLEVNTLPVVPIMKNGRLPLDSADLLAGMVVPLIYDGTVFQMLSARQRTRRPCPAGFSEINSQYCIEVNERPALDFPDAAVVCGNAGGKLCSWAEFYAACERDSIHGLNDMTGNYEWTNTTANGDDHVRMAGWVNCRSAGTNATISTTPRAFRCCYRR